MHRFPKGLKGMELALGLVLTALLFCVIIAPFTLPSGSVTDLSGSVGTIDNGPRISHFNPFAQAVYYLGDINCHQIKERTYVLNGNEMPVCSRDLGILSALPITLFALAFINFRPRFWMVIVLLIPMGLDGGLQAFTSYTSFNELRFITGILGGIAAGLFLAMIARMALSPDPASESSLSG
ncbi:MAG: hypothetical protein A4E32_01631 [Methanomassiliicoccales archaeon PtaU1.Bin124]|nr:MAG: hypothetical protein A4E32_01631 [Methanomassiliicoccales archaeon PtaU1.Bin124]